MEHKVARVSRKHEPEIAVEEFKSLDEVLNPDSRWNAIASVNRGTGESRPMKLRDHYDRVNEFNLNAAVPERIRGQFNTAKNVLLYSWLVYPFFSVAEMHVLGVLDLALRTRMGEAGIDELKRLKKSRGLFSYIEYASDHGWIRNEDFAAYHRAPFENARQKYLARKREEMQAHGLNEIAINYDEIEVPTENAVDYVSVLLETVNNIRNIHAHGDVMLYPASAWQSFEMSTDFINALYR
jgi:hypothetical protein